MNIIIAPVITEKSESLKENNVYVFKVAKKANKTLSTQPRLFKCNIKSPLTIILYDNLQKKERK